MKNKKTKNTQIFLSAQEPRGAIPQISLLSEVGPLNRYESDNIMITRSFWVSLRDGDEQIGQASGLLYTPSGSYRPIDLERVTHYKEIEDYNKENEKDYHTFSSELEYLFFNDEEISLDYALEIGRGGGLPFIYIRKISLESSVENCERKDYEKIIYKHILNLAKLDFEERGVVTKALVSIDYELSWAEEEEGFLENNTFCRLIKGVDLSNAYNDQIKSSDIKYPDYETIHTFRPYEYGCSVDNSHFGVTRLMKTELFFRGESVGDSETFTFLPHAEDISRYTKEFHEFIGYLDYISGAAITFDSSFRDSEKYNNCYPLAFLMSVKIRNDLKGLGFGRKLMEGIIDGAVSFYQDNCFGKGLYIAGNAIGDDGVEKFYEKLGFEIHKDLANLFVKTVNEDD